MPVAFVLGASGQIGRFLLPRLLASGWQVLALSREPRTTAAPNLTWVQGDVFAGMPDLPALDAVFSLGPLNGCVEWLQGGFPPGRPRIVAIGSMSRYSKHDSSDAHERALAACLAGAEQELARLADANGSAWTLLRPSLIYGAGLDRSLSLLARLACRWRVFPRVAAASGLRQPVHAEDLATACLAAERVDAAAGQAFDVGGGERLPFNAMLERVRSSLPRRTLAIPLPPFVLRAAIPFLRTRPRWRALNAAVIERLARDLIVDDAAARQTLGWAPRPFRPEAATWVAPELP